MLESIKLELCLELNILSLVLSLGFGVSQTASISLMGDDDGDGLVGDGGGDSAAMGDDDGDGLVGDGGGDSAVMGDDDGDGFVGDGGGDGDDDGECFFGGGIETPIVISSYSLTKSVVSI